MPRLKYNYTDDNFIDVDRDAPKDRMIKLKNNALHIKQEGMFGHWFVFFDKGQVPERLRGAYTSASEARKEAMAYLSSKGRTDEIIQNP